MNTDTMSFNEVEHHFNYGTISAAEMRCFAHKWVIGKWSYRERNGVIEELHIPRFESEYWSRMRGEWNIAI